MLGQRESIISDQHLKSVSSLSHHARDVVYTVVTTPTRGNLYKLTQGRPRRIQIGRGETFTQVTFVRCCNNL